MKVFKPTMAQEIILFAEHHRFGETYLKSYLKDAGFDLSAPMTIVHNPDGTREFYQEDDADKSSTYRYH